MASSDATAVHCALASSQEVTLADYCNLYRDYDTVSPKHAHMFQVIEGRVAHIPYIVLCFEVTLQPNGVDCI